MQARALSKVIEKLTARQRAGYATTRPATLAAAVNLRAVEVAEALVKLAAEGEDVHLHLIGSCESFDCMETIEVVQPVDIALEWICRQCRRANRQTIEDLGVEFSIDLPPDDGGSAVERVTPGPQLPTSVEQTKVGDLAQSVQIVVNNYAPVPPPTAEGPDKVAWWTLPKVVGAATAGSAVIGGGYTFVTLLLSEAPDKFMLCVLAAKLGVDWFGSLCAP
jgi:hypothetical protein